MSGPDLGQITTILSIGTIVSPIIFGFAMWKMTRFFVSKEEFNTYKDQASNDRSEARRQLERIADNVNRLLQSVARLQGQGNHLEHGSSE